MHPVNDSTEQQFKDGRDRRFGTANPEKLDIPFQNAMIKGGYDAYTARKRFPSEEGEGDASESDDEDEDGDNPTEEGEEHGTSVMVSLADLLAGLGDDESQDADENEDAEEGGSRFSEDYGNPIFCNARMGQARVKLPDATLVQIGGEHEDFYDPDFLIYNDVIVFHPPPKDKPDQHGNEHFGYPEAVFPPTDFHTATFVPALNAIVIIGNSSSPQADDELAKNGITPVYVLKVGTWEIEKKETTGDGPGIIWHHEATLSDDGGVLHVSIAKDEFSFSFGQATHYVVKDGELKTEEIGYGESWALDLSTWTWTHEANEWRRTWMIFRSRAFDEFLETSDGLKVSSAFIYMTV